MPLFRGPPAVPILPRLVYCELYSLGLNALLDWALERDFTLRLSMKGEVAELGVTWLEPGSLATSKSLS